MLLMMQEFKVIIKMIGIQYNKSEITSEKDLSNCLYFGRVASMIQGLELIAKNMVNIILVEF